MIKFSLKNLLNLKNKNKKRNKDIFKKTKKDKLYKPTVKNKNIDKKRKNLLKLKLNLKKRLNFLKKTYIPYFFIFFIISSLIIFGALLSPIFQIKSIEIIKKDDLTDMNIAYKAVEDIRGKPIFSIDEKFLLKKFKNYQGNIEDISLKLKLPNSLYIEIGSYKKLFNVYVSGKNYLLLENGSFTPVKEKDKKLKSINVINEFGKNKFLDYSIVYKESYIKKISEITKKVKENIIGLNITKLDFYNIERELHVEINNSTKLLFSIDNDISVDEQIKNLAIFNKEHKKINNNLVYLDLRVKNKAFFCEKEKASQCYKNLENLYPKLDIKKEETKKKK